MEFCVSYNINKLPDHRSMAEQIGTQGTLNKSVSMR